MCLCLCVRVRVLLHYAHSCTPTVFLRYVPPQIALKKVSVQLCALVTVILSLNDIPDDETNDLIRRLFPQFSGEEESSRASAVNVVDAVGAARGGGSGVTDANQTLPCRILKALFSKIPTKTSVHLFLASHLPNDHVFNVGTARKMLNNYQVKDDGNARGIRASDIDEAVKFGVESGLLESVKVPVAGACVSPSPLPSSPAPYISFLLLFCCSPSFSSLHAGARTPHFKVVPPASVEEFHNVTAVNWEGRKEG